MRNVLVSVCVLLVIYFGSLSMTSVIQPFFCVYDGGVLNIEISFVFCPSPKAYTHKQPFRFHAGDCCGQDNETCRCIEGRSRLGIFPILATGLLGIGTPDSVQNLVGDLFGYSVQDDLKPVRIGVFDFFLERFAEDPNRCCDLVSFIDFVHSRD